MKHLVSTQFGTPSESVTLHDDSDPTPGPRDVLVRMEAAAVNPSDLLRLRGLYFARPEPPAPVGGEGVEIVVDAGAQADRGLLGKRVIVLPTYTHGTWAEKVVVPHDKVVEVAPDADPLQLATLRMGQLHPVRRVRLDGQAAAVHQRRGGSAGQRQRRGMRDACRMENYRRDDLIFDVRDAGPPDGPVVVLLHGFPQHNDSWNAVTDRLTAQGYRCLAPNQRGYSPGARPSRRRDYRMSELVADLGALIDASGARRVHLVGHDWGAAVAWAAAAEMPERLATVSPISVPHPAAFIKSIATSRQGLASWYMYFFQLPRIPEWLLMRRNGVIASESLRRGGQIPAAVERDVQAMREPGAMTAAINWYRAIPLSDLRASNEKISVPTMYVWSDRDIALLPKAAHDTARYVSGEYRFEILLGVSHWIPDEQPDKLADLLLDWFAAHQVN